MECGPGRGTVAQHGEALASDPTISGSQYNHMSCRTCHSDRAANAGARIYPGAPLAGAANRPSWWGGEVLSLEQAVNVCYMRFMRGDDLDPQSETAQALLAYIEELSSTATAAENAAQSFTIKRQIGDLELADPDNMGATLYANTCQPCHGTVDAGVGRLGPEVSVIPNDTLLAHGDTYGPGCTREVFIEKVRHGGFLGFGGNMPPFSEEALSNTQLKAILLYAGAPTGAVDPRFCTPVVDTAP